MNFGFRSLCSSHDALLYSKDFFRKALDSKEIIHPALLDLSKISDSKTHKKPLQKSCSIGHPLEKFSGRKQGVRANEVNLS